MEDDRASADKLGVKSTPSFFVNGVAATLPGSYENFLKVIQGEAAKVTPTESEAVHMHFDVAVYVNGKKLNLSDDEFMEKDPTVHLHDNNGEVAHIHAEEVKLGTFVKSLGFDEAEVTGMIVNDGEVENGFEYEPSDLDRVIVIVGRSVANAVVSDKACIYSEKCPERGSPPSEGCVGGLNTPCE